MWVLKKSFSQALLALHIHDCILRSVSQDTHISLLQLHATSPDRRQALLLTWDQPWQKDMDSRGKLQLLGPDQTRGKKLPGWQQNLIYFYRVSRHV